MYELQIEKISFLGEVKIVNLYFKINYYSLINLKLLVFYREVKCS